MHHIDKKPIQDNFIFHTVTKPDESKFIRDVYFCSCGTRLIKDQYSQDELEFKSETNSYEGLNLSKILEKAGKSVSLTCGNCEKNYTKPEVYNNIYPVNKYFLESYKMVEDNSVLSLYKYKIRGFLDIKESSQVEVNYQYSYISLNKESKKLHFLDFTDESVDNKQPLEFNLGNVFRIVRHFLDNSGQAEITDNLLDVHLFINSLAGYVTDSKNINIVNELMSQMIGRAGLDILNKVISIFCGIICYPNLSTIALTKGTIFLYEMLNDCKLPNPSVLSDNGATSPLKIFNFLVNNTNAEVQAILDSYNPDKVGYVFKSDAGQKFNIHYGKVERFDENKKSILKDGNLFVREEDLKDKKVSPYIFNKIKKFSDYKTLIRYTKFISYNELIDLVMKYDIDLLLNLYPLIEFRADVNSDRVYQFVNLTISFLKRQKMLVLNKGLNKTNIEESNFVREKFVQKEIEEQAKIKYVESDIKSEELDFSLTKHVDFFTVYDDSLRMIQNLRWDPNKEFYKIKNIKELEEYHDKLVKFFNQLSNKEKNKKYVDFVYNYKFLEEYDGDLEVRLIKSPDLLLGEAEEMHNCAGSYVTRIADEKYLLFIIKDLNPNKDKKDDTKFMFGIKVSKYGLEFDQVKAAYNKQGTDRFKKQVMTYLESKDISYKELADLRLSTSTAVMEDKDFLFNYNEAEGREHVELPPNNDFIHEGQ